jgi:hypothetical protein
LSLKLALKTTGCLGTLFALYLAEPPLSTWRN